VDRAFFIKLGPELLSDSQYVLLAWHELLKLESTSGKPTQASHQHLNPPKMSNIVMCKAGRKLALFLVLAALAEQKTIIVFVLYTILADGLFNDATLAEIDYKCWS
jgi:hypothetical protein